MNASHKHPILVPYDFTEVSDTAIAHAANFAVATGSKMIILNIIDESTEKYFRQHNSMEELLRSKLEKICNGISEKYNIETSYLIQKSNIISIRSIADKQAISFMFMGIDQPHKNTSKVMKVVCTSPAPVYVVQSTYEFVRPKNIIFPIDSFPETRQKVQCAIACSKLFQAPVNLFSVKPKDKTQFYKQNVIINQIERVLNEEHIPFTFEFARNHTYDFADELLNYAQKFESSIFVLMKTPRIFAQSKITADDMKVLLNPYNVPALYVNPRDVGRYY